MNMAMKLLTRPSEKAVFFTALAGVVLATAALFLAPAVQSADSAAPATSAEGATTRPTTGPATRRTTQPAASAVAQPSARGHSPREFPLDEYQHLLDEYLRGPMVDYAALKSRGAAQLDRLVEVIADTNPGELKQLRDADFAAWHINAYNILTLKVIVDHYPVASIQDIDKPWDTKWPVAQGELTLNEIEHDVLRMQHAPAAERRAFVDPRVHFAVNCASIGCPVLLGEPFTGAKLDQMYDRGVRLFMQDPAKFRLEGTTLHLSQLLDWYGDDFRLLYEDASAKEAIGRFFAGYVDDAEAAEALRTGEFRIDWMEYDWGLNDVGG